MLLGVAVVMGGAAPAASATDEGHVRARLVADGPRLEPGGTVRVGVLFEIDPGWHIYWKNPGDAGLATEVRLGLPEGFVQGELQWPVPMNFTQPGNLGGFGYEKTVLLAAEVQAPASGTVDVLRVTAAVSWLACRDICVLGAADLEGSLPQAFDAARFAGWRESLPQRDPPFEVSVRGGFEEGSRRGRLSLWLAWPRPPDVVEFFPAAGERLKVADTRVQTRGGLTRIDLNVSVIGEADVGPDVLPSVVAVRDGSGVRRGWLLDAPLRSEGVLAIE